MTSSLVRKAPTVGAGLSDLRHALDRVGYRLAGLRDLLAIDGDLPTGLADLAVYRRRLAAESTPLGEVIALLALSWQRPVDVVAAALGRAAIKTLGASGAVTEVGGVLHPNLRLLPHGDVWIASDLRPPVGTPPDPLHVTGINPPATLLSALTVRRAGDTCLDLGTGNGIQTLLASRHCRHVVATDVNPRALAFAKFNAALNGAVGIEFRKGSWFEPVDGERFDLIVTNPPYVISPENDLVYRDSGSDPGALCGELARAMPSYLNDGGFATLLASWPLRGDDWSAMPRSWLGDNCRAWLLNFGVEEPIDHARQWNSPLAEAGAIEEFGAAIDRWTEYAARRGIDQIAYGAVVVQQCDGEQTVVRADEVRAGAGDASEQIQRVFAAPSPAAPMNAVDVAALQWRAVEGLRVDRKAVPADGGWSAGETRLRLSEGVGITVTLDPLMAEIFLAATSGSRVDAASRSVARVAEVADDEVAALINAAGAMMRELGSLGFVMPAAREVSEPPRTL